jgi:hypothetical protein
MIEMRLMSGNGYNRKRGKIYGKREEEGWGGLKKSVFITVEKREERGQHVPSIYVM